MNENEQTQIHHLKWFGLPRLMRYLKPYRLIFLSMIILGIITGLIDIVMPLFQQYAINRRPCPLAISTRTRWVISTRGL